ncbi:hypothetical protein [Bacillus sp. B15-48]|nr:hypothetical protein [Bacillus sp. B15-48]
MEKNKQQEQKETANVEFGIEFGDMNASKMYERPFPQKRKKNKREK